MIVEFHDKKSQVLNDEFIEWRHSHFEDGFFLAFKDNHHASLHSSNCRHKSGGDIYWDGLFGKGTEYPSSLTKKRKVCSTNQGELLSLADREGVAVTTCAHCLNQTPAIEQIESFTPADYVGALRHIEPNESQLKILRVHLAAPGYTVTARHLASALGFANWNSANLHYGKFAGKLCGEMNVFPSTNLSVLVEFFKAPDSEYELTLRPVVIEALRQLGIADHGNLSFQKEPDIEEPLVEGASFTVQVSAFERNPLARQKCITHYGTNCTVCGFSFSATYGSSAKDYIHVHHLACIGKEYIIDPIKDLRPVCANCHAVIHLRQPPFSIEEMKGLMSGGSNG